MYLYQHLEIIGFKVKDKITGLEGVVTSICFDLSGSIQALLTSNVNESGEFKQTWMDTIRLEKISTERVLELSSELNAIILAE